MAKASGEIGVSATSGGRKLTLDPIDGKKNSITIPAWEVETTIVAGLRVNWIEGENELSEVELNVGAGCGSPWGTFHYKRKSDGATVQLVFDAADLVSSLAELAEQKLVARETK